MYTFRTRLAHRAALALAGLAAPLALAAAPAPAAPTWQRIDNPAPVVGLDGKTHRAQCSGFPGTDPSFRFWARKGAGGGRGSARNLVVYFEGGGACWDNLTCTFPIAGLPAQVPQFFVPQIPPGADPASYGGLFSATNPANPVADWDMVYIPYCTGDIHTGSATRTYANAGHPVLPLPSTFSIEHRGFDNFMVVLDWMKRNFDKPRSVLVTGSSAGGYGATTNSPWVGRAFPHARLFVLADASQGVTTAAFDGGTPGRGAWNPQLAPWVFGSDANAVPGHEFAHRLAQGLPKARVAQFTTALDNVQIGFYGLMKQFYGPGGSCPNPAVDWYQQMRQQVLADNSQLRNFRSYVAGGGYHTLLRSDTFYTETSAGQTFASWLTGMLSPPRGHGEGDDDDDHNDRHFGADLWQNAACPTCLIELACPP